MAFAMFVQGDDPERPTDLLQMTAGIGGWTAAAPPTVELTLALGLWNAGGPGEMVILPLKMTLTFDRPGTYWAVCELGGQTLAEVPFSVTADPPPASGGTRD